MDRGLQSTGSQRVRPDWATEHTQWALYSLPSLLKINNLFYFKVIPYASWPTKTMLHDKYKFSYYSEDKDFHIFYLVKHHSEILWASVKKVLVSSPLADEETEAQQSSIISLSESTWSASSPQPALLYSSPWRNPMFTKITVGEVFDYTQTLDCDTLPKERLLFPHLSYQELLIKYKNWWKTRLCWCLEPTYEMVAF